MPLIAVGPLILGRGATPSALPSVWPLRPVASLAEWLMDSTTSLAHLMHAQGREALVELTNVAGSIGSVDTGTLSVGTP